MPSDVQEVEGFGGLGSAASEGRLMGWTAVGSDIRLRSVVCLVPFVRSHNFSGGVSADSSYPGSEMFNLDDQRAGFWFIFWLRKKQVC
jgi:hypothetical protein